MSYLVCGIYEKRPATCKRYPQEDHYIFDACGYRFSGGERRGDCYLDCQATCCMEPRAGGEPGGASLPEIAGGESCKYLISVEKAPKGAVVEKPEG